MVAAAGSVADLASTITSAQTKAQKRAAFDDAYPRAASALVGALDLAAPAPARPALLDQLLDCRHRLLRRLPSEALSLP
jgi:hypothetical protein